MQAELVSLETRIGYRFIRPELLRRALTHSSLANETRTRNSPLSDNEQLEFLGDSVLGFLIAESLFRKSRAESKNLELGRLRVGLTLEFRQTATKSNAQSVTVRPPHSSIRRRLASL